MGFLKAAGHELWTWFLRGAGATLGYVVMMWLARKLLGF